MLLLDAQEARSRRTDIAQRIQDMQQHGRVGLQNLWRSLVADAALYRGQHTGSRPLVSSPSVLHPDPTLTYQLEMFTV